MQRVLEVRQAIYDYFQNDDSIMESMNEDQYTAYYTSMYLIQDSAESLIEHRKKGFDKNNLQAYIEFWGVMQAVIINQDAICELYKVIVGETIKIDILEAWPKLRVIRNRCAGHPVKCGHKMPYARSFMSRLFGNYDCMHYEMSQGGAAPEHPKIELGKLIDDYALEAHQQVSNVYKTMETRWVKR